MTKIYINIPEELSDYVLSKQLDFDTISFLITRMKDNTNEDKKFWLNILDERKYELEITKNFVYNEYIYPRVKNNVKNIWNIDFNNNIIEVKSYDSEE